MASLGSVSRTQTSLRRHSHVREFDEYLPQRWAKGCHNATQLFREIRARGYRGSRQMVSYHVSSWRAERRVSKTKPPKRLAPKDVAILMWKRPECRSAEQQETLERLATIHPRIEHLSRMALEFREALQSKEGIRTLAWINHAVSSAHVSLARFAHGLRRDLKPVIAAIESPWSSGQVEGQINRLKALKRQMYGRAGFNLLRARVLPLSPLGPLICTQFAEEPISAQVDAHARDAARGHGRAVSNSSQLLVRRE